MSVILTGLVTKLQVLQIQLEIFPTSILKGKATFQLELSENKDTFFLPSELMNGSIIGKVEKRKKE